MNLSVEAIETSFERRMLRKPWTPTCEQGSVKENELNIYTYTQKATVEIFVSHNEERIFGKFNTRRKY